MAFVSQGRKSSQTMWIQGSSVDGAQVAKFLAATANNQPSSRKAETWPPTMLAKQQSAAGHFQVPWPVRSGSDMPAIGAMEAALRYRGAIYISRTG